jgi:hypothetical protein
MSGQASATLVYNSMCSLRVRLRMVQLLGRGKRADTLSMFSLLPTTVAVCVSTTHTATSPASYEDGVSRASPASYE